MRPGIWILRDETKRVKSAEEDKLGLPAELNVKLQPVSTAGITAFKRLHVVLDGSTRKEQIRQSDIK